PTGLSPNDAIRILGVTCDSPLNTWTKHITPNFLTKDPVGERLDYIFYKKTPEMVCKSVEVTVKDQISGIGSENSGVKNYSDHYGVHAVFSLKPAVLHLDHIDYNNNNNHQQSLSVSNSNINLSSSALSSSSSSSSSLLSSSSVVNLGSGIVNRP